MIFINGYGRTSYGYLISIIKVMVKNDQAMNEEIYAPLVKVDDEYAYYQLPESGQIERVNYNEYIEDRSIIYTHSLIMELFSGALSADSVSEVYYAHRDGIDSVLSLIKSHSAKDSRYGSCGATEEGMYECSYILSVMLAEWRAHMISVLDFMREHPDIPVRLISFEELTITREREIIQEIAERYNSTVDVDKYLKKLKGELSDGRHFYNKGIKKNKAEAYLDSVNRELADNLCRDILSAFGYEDYGWLTVLSGGRGKISFMLGSDQFNDAGLKTLLALNCDRAGIKSEILRVSDTPSDGSAMVYLGTDRAERPEGSAVYPFYLPYFDGMFYIFDMKRGTKRLMKDIPTDGRNLIIRYRDVKSTEGFAQGYLKNCGIGFDIVYLDSEYDYASSDGLNVAGYDRIFITLYDAETVTNTDRYKKDTAQHRRMIKHVIDLLKDAGADVYSYFPFFG